ncbi:hypothetical protein E2C01_067766 [Portunus trituberculatus]|uniref:Uncharacterized protein n=1 Tax=Portunus trituberculatus TaxID=210409 RepID=A0A5B7HW02_PORTR|nr:hypothetical protein [Portunus trituberculatus]
MYQPWSKARTPLRAPGRGRPTRDLHSEQGRRSGSLLPLDYPRRNSAPLHSEGVVAAVVWCHEEEGKKRKKNNGKDQRVGRKNEGNM